MQILCTCRFNLKDTDDYTIRDFGWSFMAAKTQCVSAGSECSVYAMNVNLSAATDDTESKRLAR